MSAIFVACGRDDASDVDGDVDVTVVLISMSMFMSVR